MITATTNINYDQSHVDEYSRNEAIADAIEREMIETWGDVIDRITYHLLATPGRRKYSDHERAQLLADRLTGDYSASWDIADYIIARMNG